MRHAMKSRYSRKPQETRSLLETVAASRKLPMTLALDRGLALLERLCGQPEGMPLTALADELDMPRSACHRLLSELQRRGYVRQMRSQGDYMLTAKLASMGLGFLSSSGIVDIAEPLLERLAHESGELVRLSIIDGDRLTWVAKAQGARKGLRYDRG